MLNVYDSEKIHEFKNENPEFQKLICKMEESEKYTLSKISHEIRNPVTLINSFLQLLEGKYPDIALDEYWKKVMENMHFLRLLLDELSSYNNSFQVIRKEANLYTIISEIVTSVGPTMEGSNVNVHLVKKTALPTLPLDTLKIQQTFYNLLRNAHEAIGENGEVTITLESDGNDITIEVTDTGKGIPEEYLDDLFQPFVTHKKDGTGLGLSIAQRVIESHNGTIQAESKEGEGTTFRIILPIC